MSPDQIWNTQATVADTLNIRIPAWIDQDIDLPTIASIMQGGCASGAYMPAVTYGDAQQTMAQHGDDVLQHIEDQLGELPDHNFEGFSWSGIAVFYLSSAVELWASDIMTQLEALEVSDSDQ